jgi:hypothetical protein
VLRDKGWVEGAPGQRLQALEGQPLGIRHAGEIEPADEGRDLLAVAVGQRNHGIDGDFLGIHGFPHAVGSLSRLSVGVAD